VFLDGRQLFVRSSEDGVSHAGSMYIALYSLCPLQPTHLASTSELVFANEPPGGNLYAYTETPTTSTIRSEICLSYAVKEQ
jgi:hypothetical protein